MMYEEQVTRGAALLDAEYEGWRDEIEPYALTMIHGEKCVLGRLYGDYSSGLETLGFSISESALHGFTLLPENNELLVDDKPWVELKRTWIREILQDQSL